MLALRGKNKTWVFFHPLSYGYEKIGGESVDKNDIVKAISDYNKIYKQSENVIVGFF